MKQPTIGEVRQLGQKYAARGVALLVIDDRGRFAMTSWGRSQADCRGMARLVDRVVTDMEVGRVQHPWEPI